MKNMTRLRKIVLFLVVLLYLSVSGGGPAQAQALFGDEPRLTMQYGVYMGGFRIMDVSMALVLQARNYSGDLKAKPYGVLGHLLPWAGEYHISGLVEKSVLVPQRHVKKSRWREDRDQYVFHYRNGALVRLETVSIDDGVREETSKQPDSALHKDTVDIMTAALRLMQSATMNGKCASDSEVFDGKRRFRLHFTDKGEENLSASRYNRFSGKALRCDVEMIPLLGYRKKPQGYYKIQEEARKRGQLPTIWMAAMWPDGPLVPVRMMVRSEYGAVLVHLQDIKRGTVAAQE